jgi:FkbM family methyltransferase
MLKSVLSSINQIPLWRWPVKVWGSVYTAPTFDRLASLHAHRLGWMGKTEKKFLASIVQRDSIVADIGANQGLYALWLARIARNGHVYAFEPDPKLFECLEWNVRNNRLKNVSAIRAAASNRSGTVAFVANGLNRGDNRVTNDRGLACEQVKAMTIDEILAHSRLDLLKIDVQGFEVEVLLGARQTLGNNQDLIIVFEFWPYGLRLIGRQPGELLDLLREAGFSISTLDRQGRLVTISQEILHWKRKTQYCNLIARKAQR